MDMSELCAGIDLMLKKQVANKIKGILQNTHDKASLPDDDKKRLDLAIAFLRSCRTGLTIVVDGETDGFPHDTAVHDLREMLPYLNKDSFHKFWQDQKQLQELFTRMINTLVAVRRGGSVKNRKDGAAVTVAWLTCVHDQASATEKIILSWERPTKTHNYPTTPPPGFESTSGFSWNSVVIGLEVFDDLRAKGQL